MSDDPNPRVVSVPVALLEEIAEHVNLTLPVRYGPILDVLIAAAPQKQQHETHTWSCVTQPKECPGINAEEPPRHFTEKERAALRVARYDLNTTRTDWDEHFDTIRSMQIEAERNLEG